MFVICVLVVVVAAAAAAAAAVALSVAILAQARSTGICLSFHHVRQPISMVRRECNIPVRYGKSIAHVSSIEEAAALMLQLNAIDCAPREAADCVLSAAASAANDALGRLIKPCNLIGDATKNLGTALRARAVRDLLHGVSTPQKMDLLKELSYIAQAADAKRHLTRTSIDEALSSLRSAVATEESKVPPAKAPEPPKKDSKPPAAKAPASPKEESKPPVPKVPAPPKSESKPPAPAPAPSAAAAAASNFKSDLGKEKAQAEFSDDLRVMMAMAQDMKASLDTQDSMISSMISSTLT